MTITALRAFTDNYIWVIVDEANHTLTCVDPGEAEPVLSYAKKNALTLTHILLTHHHHDHIGGVSDLLQAYPKASVYGPKDPRISHLTTPVSDEDIVHIGHLAFRIMCTPGHTSTHICYQEPTKGWLFCGDTLFSAGCGRVFDGTLEQLYHSIRLLKHLPNDTKVYCGHEYTLKNLSFAATVEPENTTISDYSKHLQAQKHLCSLPSTIGLEKKINPFMRTTAPTIHKFALMYGINIHDSFAIFRCLRAQKDIFQG